MLLTIAIIFSGRYISEEGARNLKAYQYKGCDSSLMLKYITNPMYNRIVLWFPLWLAPNVITMAGLVCSIISYFIMMYYCPLLDGPAPRWAYLVEAAALISYQALDAMDGKQARRTGSSSALGMLFDHGCDALNTTLSSLSLCAAFQLGAGWVSFVFWLAATFVFYWATIEEFYTGEVICMSNNFH
jgi:ethanolaminephosphotransferase